MLNPGRESRGRVKTWLGAVLILSVLMAAGCQPGSAPPALQRLFIDGVEQELGPLVQDVEQASLEDHSVVSAGWQFEGDEQEPAWTTLRDVLNLRVEGGMLQGLGRGSDPSISTRVAVAADELDYLWIRMGAEHGGMGQMFWTSEQEGFMSEAKSARFTVVAGSAVVDYVLPVGANPRWHGTITSLRLDPPPQAGEFAVEFVRVVRMTEPPTGLAALRGQVGKAVLDNDTRPALFSFPPHDVSWNVQVASTSLLRFSYGILPDAWQRPGSAARFEVYASRSGSQTETALFSDLVRPRTHPEDRAWKEAEVDLGDFAEGDLELSFRVRRESEEGVPEELSGAFAHAVWGNPVVVAADVAQERPNIVLIGLDTIRVDRVGAFGYDLPTTPNIDRMAAESTIFERAISQAPWTLPSFASLFTSLYPSMAGVYESSHALQAEAAALATVLRDSGYHTVGFTGGGYAGRGWRMDRGFDRFWEGARSKVMASRLEEWLDSTGPGPLFLYLHTYEAHDYFRATAEQIAAAAEVRGGEIDPVEDVYGAIIVGQGAGLDADQMREVSALYDGGVRLADGLVGEWLELLRGAGILEHSVVVLFADHGEGFGEHGLVHHGNSLYEEMVHVPLLIRVSPQPSSDGQGRRIQDMVELIDISPTVLELAGLPAPTAAQGRSLVPYLLPTDVLGHELAPKRYAYSEIPFHRVYALRTPDWTYIYSNRPGVYRGCGPRPGPPEERFCEELYDLRSDPAEGVDLADSAPALLRDARANFVAYFHQATPGLRVVALGGADEQSITVRMGGTEEHPTAELYYAEDGDQSSDDATIVNLRPGDLDMVSWNELDEEVLDRLVLEVVPAEGDEMKFDLYAGPSCSRQIQAGQLVMGRDLLQEDPPELSIPGPPSRARVCVSYNPPRSPQPSLQEISPEAIRRLRALGYVQ
jgi:arylsulfatase A-like enzyme